jgi:hypothetical protein
MLKTKGLWINLYKLESYFMMVCYTFVMPDLASMDLDETEAKTIENYTCVYFISDGG